MEFCELDEIGQKIRQMLNRYADKFPEKAESAVTKSAKHLVRVLDARSPRSSGEFQRSWEVDKFVELKNVKVAYVKNISKSKSFLRNGIKTQIPKINLVEGKEGNPWKKAKPFVRQTVREEEARVLEIFWQELNGQEE